MLVATNGVGANAPLRVSQKSIVLLNLFQHLPDGGHRSFCSISRPVAWEIPKWVWGNGLFFTRRGRKKLIFLPFYGGECEIRTRDTLRYEGL